MYVYRMCRLEPCSFKSDGLKYYFNADDLTPYFIHLLINIHIFIGICFTRKCHFFPQTICLSISFLDVCKVYWYIAKCLTSRKVILLICDLRFFDLLLFTKTVLLVFFPEGCEMTGSQHMMTLVPVISLTLYQFFMYTDKSYEATCSIVSHSLEK